MKILVLGAAGMLGHKVFQVLRERFPETLGSIRGQLAAEPYRKISLFQAGNIVENVDAANLPELERLLREMQPQVVVNCVGIIKQRSEAKAYIPSLTLNALLPHQIAAVCEAWGGRLIHFSTDCVFNGRRGGYVEEDPSDAEDLYGKTKFLGEVASENALTLRTSIIGRELSNFQSLLEWLLSQNHRQVSGYTSAFYSGVTTNHLAGLIADLIERHTDLAGLYQVTSSTISKYELLTLLRDAYTLDIEIAADDSFHCDRSMNGDKFRRATGYGCPPWTELAAQLAADTTPYDKWR